MDEWLNVRDEIMFDYHDDIYEMVVMPNGLVILFHQYQHLNKEHLQIIEMVKEIFDFDKIYLEINISYIEEIEGYVLRILLEEVK